VLNVQMAFCAFGSNQSFCPAYLTGLTSRKTKPKRNAPIRLIMTSGEQKCTEKDTLHSITDKSKRLVVLVRTMRRLIKVNPVRAVTIGYRVLSGAVKLSELLRPGAVNTWAHRCMQRREVGVTDRKERGASPQAAAQDQKSIEVNREYLCPSNRR
jgi:hypothetical protein